MERKKKYNIAYFLVAFLEAALIGIGGILPGVSGGVLCVIFGFYRPLVETLADPIHKLVPNLKMILPLALGSLAGFLCFAGLVSELMKKNSEIAICIFAGLIIGTLPDMWKDAGKSKRTALSYVSFALTTVIFLSFFMYLKFGKGINVTPNIVWYFFCGVIWGISIVVPGLSSSSTLIFLGLYQPMTEGIAKLQMQVLIPILVGIVITIVGLSKFVSGLYEKHHSVASHIIIGIVIATTIPILPYKFNNVADFLIDLLCICVGIAIAVIIGIVCPKLAAMAEKQTDERVKNDNS